MFGQNKKKCPVCSGLKISTSKPSIIVRLREAIWPIQGVTRDLNLCADCNFSWED